MNFSFTYVDSEDEEYSIPPPRRLTHQANNNKMSSLKPPKPLVVNNDIDMATEWSDWMDEYNNYFIAAKISGENDEIKVANLRAALGRDGNKILRNLGLSEDDMKKIDKVKDKLSEHFSPARNKTYERCQFHRLKQQPNESFEDFLQKLREQVKRCAYGTNDEEFTMDQIVLGIHSDSTRQKLWVEETLTLDKAKRICRADERVGKQITELHKESSETVDQIKREETKTFKCKRCGTTHGYRSCPAFNKECRACGMRNHFESMCKSKNKKSSEQEEEKKEKEEKRKYKKQKKVRAVSSDSDDSDDDYQYEYSKTCSAIHMEHECDDSDGEDSKMCSAIHKQIEMEVHSVCNEESEKWCGTVCIKNKNLKLKLDTGANCNVLSEKDVIKFGGKLYGSKTKRLLTYSGEAIAVIGQVTFECETKKNREKVDFKVVKQNLQPILGRKMCEKLGFIVRVNEVDVEDEKTNTSEFIGCCKNFEYDIDFIDNPKFKIIPARRIPYSLREKAKQELIWMEKVGVIKKVSEPTPAVSPMLVVEQKGKVRVCMDPTDLNKNIKRRHFPLKTVEEIAALVSGSKHFTKLDCKKGFWQIKVSERTSKYLTFSTPWGRYSYLRLPFGICSAPEIFTEIMNRTLEGIDGCEIAMDDIFLHATTSEQLKRTEEAVIKRLKKAGFTLNDEKCEYNKHSVKFLGHVFTPSGYKADDDKIKGIRQLKVPTSIKELRRILGMVNYLGKFIENLSELTEPLRKLLHKETAWQWESEHQQAFDNIKTTLTTTPVLAYYDVNKNVKLSVDASSKAMGACLMQGDRPVAYATRAFDKTQQNHPQIVKEALAIRFGCNKFHDYIYGKELAVETDHKPLETIFKNHIHRAPLRLQRILWDIIEYSPAVKYIKGTKLPIADTLSRDCTPDEIENLDNFKVCAIIATSMTEPLQQCFVRETKNDRELQLLKSVVLTGWPDDDAKLPSEIKKICHLQK